MAKKTEKIQKPEKPVRYVTIGKNKYLAIHLDKYADKDLICWLLRDKLLLDSAPVAVKKKLYQLYWFEKAREQAEKQQQQLEQKLLEDL